MIERVGTIDGCAAPSAQSRRSGGGFDECQHGAPEHESAVSSRAESAAIAGDVRGAEDQRPVLELDTPNERVIPIVDMVRRVPLPHCGREMEFRVLKFLFSFCVRCFEFR